jgi:hypothetical protein
VRPAISEDFEVSMPMKVVIKYYGHKKIADMSDGSFATNIDL